MMVAEYKRVIDKIPNVVKPLMSPHLTKLDAALEPGMCQFFFLILLR